VLVPSRYAPEDLWCHRPSVNRVMSLKEMEQGVAAALATSALATPDP
jgi:hypothetical protein